MAPSHIPILVTALCASPTCDTSEVETLIRTNLGPLLNAKDYVRCDGKYPMECEIYAPWSSSCACCKHLKETFASPKYVGTDAVQYFPTAAVLPVNFLVSVEVQCALPKRYHGCHEQFDKYEPSR